MFFFTSAVSLSLNTVLELPSSSFIINVSFYIEQASHISLSETGYKQGIRTTQRHDCGHSTSACICTIRLLDSEKWWQSMYIKQRLWVRVHWDPRPDPSNTTSVSGWKYKYYTFRHSTLTPAALTAALGGRFRLDLAEIFGLQCKSEAFLFCYISGEMLYLKWSSEV